MHPYKETWSSQQQKYKNSHTYTYRATVGSPFAITPTKRLSSLLSHTQAGSQRKPMDQFSTEKLWHSSNVMGFDVDAELHYRTPMKPVKPLFISLFPMQRTLAGSMPHFSDAGVFFSSSSCTKKSVAHDMRTYTHTSPLLPPQLVLCDWFLPVRQKFHF